MATMASRVVAMASRLATMVTLAGTPEVAAATGTSVSWHATMR
jgi:hypothetical protein